VNKHLTRRFLIDYQHFILFFPRKLKYFIQLLVYGFEIRN
jgi:hypothetical protein